MLVKLKEYFNQGGGLFPPDTIINLPDEKAKALIANKGAEAYNPTQKDKSNTQEGKTGAK